MLVKDFVCESGFLYLWYELYYEKDSISYCYILGWSCFVLFLFFCCFFLCQINTHTMYSFFTHLLLLLLFYLMSIIWKSFVTHFWPLQWLFPSTCILLFQLWFFFLVKKVKPLCYLLICVSQRIIIYFRYILVHTSFNYT